MEIAAILIFWVTLYLAADVYYEKLLDSLKHPIAGQRIPIDESNEKRFRITVFSPVAILLFFAAFRKMPALNYPFAHVWVACTLICSTILVYSCVKTFFPLMVNSFLKEKHEYRMQRVGSYRVSIIQTTLALIAYICLRIMS